MADIKKTLLKKQVAGKVYGLYPETSADIVKYGESSTVGAELAALIAKMGDGAGSVTQQIADAIEQCKKDILGLDESNPTINEAYDTLREVAEWIENDTTGAAALTNKVAALETDVTALKPDVAQAKTDIADLKTRTTAAESAIDDLEAGAMAVQVVASDFDETTMNANDLYFVELAAATPDTPAE